MLIEQNQNGRKKMAAFVSRRQIRFVWLIILSWSTTDVIGLNLEELSHQLQQLQSNYNEIKNELAIKENRLQVVELKVEQQELLLNALKDRQSNDKSTGQIVDKQSAWKGMNGIWRTCRELATADPFLESGMYWIDPDGQGGEDPINVYCNMALGSTSVKSDECGTL